MWIERGSPRVGGAGWNGIRGNLHGSVWHTGEEEASGNDHAYLGNLQFCSISIHSQS